MERELLGCAEDDLEAVKLWVYRSPKQSADGDGSRCTFDIESKKEGGVACPRIIT